MLIRCAWPCWKTLSIDWRLWRRIISHARFLSILTIWHLILSTLNTYSFPIRMFYTYVFPLWLLCIPRKSFDISPTNCSTIILLKNLIWPKLWPCLYSFKNYTHSNWCAPEAFLVLTDLSDSIYPFLHLITLLSSSIWQPALWEKESIWNFIPRA